MDSQLARKLVCINSVELLLLVLGGNTWHVYMDSRSIPVEMKSTTSTI